MIFLIVVLLAYSPLIYLWFRNEAVYKFRIQIIDEDFENGAKKIDEGDYSTHERQYEKLPSYNNMVFSFKPLTKKYWLK